MYHNQHEHFSGARNPISGAAWESASYSSGSGVPHPYYSSAPPLHGHPQESSPRQYWHGMPFAGPGADREAAYFHGTRPPPVETPWPGHRGTPDPRPAGALADRARVTSVAAHAHGLHSPTPEPSSRAADRDRANALSQATSTPHADGLGVYDSPAAVSHTPDPEHGRDLTRESPFHFRRYRSEQ